MLFNPATEELYTNSGKLIKKLHSPFAMEWDVLQVDIGNTRSRICDKCIAPVLDTSQYKDRELWKILQEEPETYLKIDLNQENIDIVYSTNGIGKQAKLVLPEGFPIIQTERDVSKINSHVNNGFIPVCEEIIPNIKCMPRYCVLQNLITKEFVLFKDSDGYCNDFEKYKVVIDWTHYYPFPYEQPFAAYLVPQNLEANTIVIIEDPIEDLISVDWETGSVRRVQHVNAVWDGKQIISLYSSAEHGALYIG